MPEKEEGIVDVQLSLNRIPDLSLHISLPNSAPSSICSGGESGNFHIWRTEGANNNDTRCSIRAKSDPLADTELSLANPSSSSSEVESRRLWRKKSYRNDLLGASEKLIVEPIKGIPVVYNNSGNQSSCFPYSSGGFEHMPRFNGITMESLRPAVSQQFQYLDHHHQYHHQQQYHIGGSDLSNGFRSRFIMPRFQSKRNMRAPRMRWTSSLHARFIHAVELLGGHESTYIYIYLHLFLTNYIYIYIGLF